jgi:hypothetical protein
VVAVEELTMESRQSQTAEAFGRLVDEELAKLDTSYSTDATPERTVTAYHRAAAVLSTFDTSLRPAGEPAPGESIEHALVDAEPLVRSGEIQFRLLPDVRRHVLEALGTPEAMRAAREANRARPSDSVQLMFDRYVAGTAPTLEQQTLGELASTFEIAPWLLGLMPTVPTPQQVRARIDVETLLSPFEDLVGAHFGGREKELNELSDYVGVLGPSTFLESVRRGVQEVFSLHEKPPLVIYGPGGYGKSTLMSRFILQHARLDDAQRFPFVYIDFDRATIAADEPLTILVEAVRQLGIQYVHAQPRGNELREAWRVRMGRSRRSPVGRSSSASPPRPPVRRERAPFIEDFKSFLSTLDLDDRPMLLVLDTFEEVQRRSTAYVRELWLFLAELQKANPRLRTVLSGRAPVKGVGFDGEPLATQLRELERLDVDASSAILEKQGLPPDMARRIASRVGGSPLTLKLAAQLVKKISSAPDGHVTEELDEDALGRAVAEGEIERYLYTRILEHIGDERVRALAHPGLVLRRVTADLILRVLAEPCDLKITSAQDAQKLFDGLRQEVSLVTPTDQADALRHRPDLRQLMLRFMERTDKDRVPLIHRGAADYYRERNLTDPIERAEEIYHRLALGEYGPKLDERWLSGVETWLFSALEELPPAARTWLATRLRVELPPEDRGEALLEVWERDADRRARELLALHQAQSALGVVQERTDRSAASPLFLTQTEIFSALGRHDEALETLDRGIRRAFESGSDALRTDLQIAAARLELERSRSPEAHKRLDEVEPLAVRRNDTLHLMSIALTRMDAFRAGRTDAGEEGEEVVALREQLRDWCAATSDEQLMTNIDLTRRVGSEIGARDPAALVRAIRLAGIGTPERHQLRILGDALEEWDRQLMQDDRSEAAQSKDATPLSRLVYFGDASERTWKSFVLTAPVADIDAACRRIVQEFTPPPHVAAVLARILGGTASESVPSVEESRPARAAFSLEAPQMVRAAEALLDAYPSRNALQNLLEFRFGRNLSAITAEKDVRSTVSDLIAGAHAEGWDADLLFGAYEGNPGNRQLSALVRDLDLVTSPGDVVDRLARSRPDVDPHQLATRLATLQGQVCRIEPSGLNGGPYATGFLVGPDVVCTVASALMALVNGPSPPDRVRLRFDYVRRDDLTGETGTAYSLHTRGWLVDRADHLDLVCVRLAGEPGRQPIGGTRALPDAPPRNWMQLPERSSTLEPGAPIVLIQYPQSEPLKVTLHDRGVERLAAGGRELRYRAGTSPGAAGAPIFDAGLQLIGMHNGSVGGWRNIGLKKGTPITPIIEWLRSRGTLGVATGATAL